ncbi:MAG TPA: DUF2490 domain-containing protein [Chryseolinea sp.]|nr:DUF2490 domain-containing protein [Chryseolinea sp.]
MKKFSLIIFMLCAALTSQAQREVTEQSLYWIRYQNQLLFSPKLYWTNEIDNRRFFSPDVQNQLIIHSRLHYKINRWDFAGGLTFSWIFAQQPELGYDHAVSEFRPVTEVSYELPIGNVFFQSRVRLDHRFFQEDPDKSVFEESSYVLRFRYRAQVRIPLKKDDENNSRITLRIADEIMLNHTSNTFDQNRIYVSVDFYLTKNISLEPQYIYIFQRRFGTDAYFERNVIRFSILHKIGLY